LNRPEFVQRAYLRATNKPTAPSSGTKKYNQLIGYGEYLVENWLTERGTEWESTFDYRSFSGTVGASDTFAFPTAIRKISTQEGNYVRILHSDGETETEYELVPASRLYEYRYANVCAVVGRSLMFPQAFTATDAQFGGTIVAPSYGFVTFPDNDDDDIAVDDPNWLVVMAAAEFVRNDITRQQQYPNLIAEANTLMAKMKENNGDFDDDIYRPNIFLDTDTEWL